MGVFNRPCLGINTVELSSLVHLVLAASSLHMPYHSVYLCVLIKPYFKHICNI